MDFAPQKPGRLGGAGLALAMLALVAQLLFPAGFMADTAGTAHQAGSIPIVICTAQGQIVTAWDVPSHAGSKKAPARSMAGCPFAGHATASAPPVASVAATPVAFEAYLAPARAYAVFPGRGLAAPPPPAIGPPLRV